MCAIAESSSRKRTKKGYVMHYYSELVLNKVHRLSGEWNERISCKQRTVLHMCWFHSPSHWLVPAEFHINALIKVSIKLSSFFMKLPHTNFKRRNNGYNAKVCANSVTMYPWWHQIEEWYSCGLAAGVMSPLRPYNLKIICCGIPWTELLQSRGLLGF